MALSPWPARTAVASLAAAILELGAALGEADDTVTVRLGATVAALVERYAPDAPQPIKCEAVIRTAAGFARRHRTARAARARAKSRRPSRHRRPGLSGHRARWRSCRHGKSAGSGWWRHETCGATIPRHHRPSALAAWDARRFRRMGARAVARMFRCGPAFNRLPSRMRSSPAATSSYNRFKCYVLPAPGTHLDGGRDGPLLRRSAHLPRRPVDVVRWIRDRRPARAGGCIRGGGCRQGDRRRRGIRGRGVQDVALVHARDAVPRNVTMWPFSRKNAAHSPEKRASAPYTTR